MGPAGQNRDNADSAHAMRRVSAASVVVAVVLVVVKAAAWDVTGSVALLASLVDSVVDAMASVVSMVAVHYSLAPPDKEHRFGHGKLEALAGLAQAGFVEGSAILLGVHAFTRLSAPQAVSEPLLGVGAVAFATVLTLLLVLAQRRVVARTGSTAIEADSLHYRGDLLMNLAVVGGLLAGGWGWGAVDAWLGLLIAGYLIVAAWKIARTALDVLMDRELGDEVREEVRHLTLSHPEVRGVHEIRTRRSGLTSIIQLHAELDPNLPLREAHRIACEVEELLRGAFPGADVIIHQDPVGLEDTCHA